MRPVSVLNGQTVFDVALQECGDAAAAFDIAAINDMEVTSAPPIGTTLYVPDAAAGRSVAREYAAKGVRPATACSEND